MSTPKLDDALQAYYESIEPSGPALRSTANAAAVRRVSRWMTAAAAAVLGGFLLLWFAPAPRPSSHALVVRVADEVWGHFLGLKPPEVVASNYTSIAEGLPRLDFGLVGPQRALAGRPVGGRYCSLDGQLAAQVVLESESGRHSVLYVTRSAPRFQGMGEHLIERGTGQVHIWRENGLVYALAKSTGP